MIVDAGRASELIWGSRRERWLANPMVYAGVLGIFKVSRTSSASAVACSDEKLIGGWGNVFADQGHCLLRTSLTSRTTLANLLSLANFVTAVWT